MLLCITVISVSTFLPEVPFALSHVFLLIKSIPTSPSLPTLVPGTDGIALFMITCLFHQTLKSLKAEIPFSLAYPALKTMTGAQQQMLNICLWKKWSILSSPLVLTKRSN